ncbi:DNA mismatch repair endonuclease MutL [Psychrobacter sp. ASPA161_6]|uniref:DNA mismatch repair endonuclease MutL n=1 Tax=Psychrobacter sp. ASPA161_6 TaxID=3160962 RepID=UPI003F7EC1F4
MPQMPDNHFNTRIKKLSPLLINQLAAGEVVTRPAAVVKELLENAIDADATNIEIHITQGGMGMIEVIDNGVGIHPDDMVMAITRHATSKVADVANLHGITTLGFRGEALAATAAVSRLTLTSSHDDSGIGRQLQVAGVLDDIPKMIPVVHHRGTTITVKDLYFNVPARRGNLKSIATEFGHIETIVREVALARADVALSLFHDNKKRLSLSSNARVLLANSMPTSDGSISANPLPLSRLEQATSAELTVNALEIMIDLSSLWQPSTEYTDSTSSSSQAGIYGWLWPINKQAQQQDSLPKLLYINGRLVKELIISNQLRQLAQSAHLNGIGYALYFDLPTQWLNINVHPSKQRIKISPLNNVMAHLSHAIHAKLKTITTMDTVTSTSYNRQALDYNNSPSQSFTTIPRNTSPTTHSRQSQQVQTPKQLYQLSVSAPILSNPFLQRSKQSYSEMSYRDESSAQSINALSEVLTKSGQTNSADISSSSSIVSKPLPVCLDIITHLNDIATESANAKDIDSKSLPWLLFYHQAQCLLISAADWQSKLSVLFESQVLSNNVSKKDELLKSPAYINQQLATVSSQMSAQDLIVFIEDIDSLITDNAIKIIDSHQLVASMFSPLNKQ